MVYWSVIDLGWALGVLCDLQYIEASTFLFNALFELLAQSRLAVVQWCQDA